MACSSCARVLQEERPPGLPRHSVEGIGEGARGVNYRPEGWLGGQGFLACRITGTRRAGDPPQGRAHLADAGT
jgi:hypothetical protein